MCINSSSVPSKRHNSIRVRRLTRWRRLRKGAGTKKMAVCIKTDVIQMKNLKLLMENQSIMVENEKLRKKALLLHKENQTLLAQLRKRSSLIPQITSEKEDITH
ncbi:hypothetical protein PTKIN_Ptkin12aG0197200 [Pterospermum kingtungense]